LGRCVAATLPVLGRWGVAALPLLGRLGVAALPLLGRLGVAALPLLGRSGVMPLPLLGRSGVMPLPLLGRSGVMPLPPLVLSPVRSLDCRRRRSSRRQSCRCNLAGYRLPSQGLSLGRQRRVALLKPLLTLLMRAGLLLLAFRERAGLLLLASLVPVRVVPLLLASLQQTRVCWLDCRRRRSSRRRLCRHILAAYRRSFEGLGLGQTRRQEPLLPLPPLERTQMLWLERRRRRSSRRRWCRYILAVHRSS
jgi:hypothetical protein